MHQHQHQQQQQPLTGWLLCEVICCLLAMALACGGGGACLSIVNHLDCIHALQAGR
jgi:hypothetical protein